MSSSKSKHRPIQTWIRNSYPKNNLNYRNGTPQIRAPSKTITPPPSEMIATQKQAWDTQLRYLPEKRIAAYAYAAGCCAAAAETKT